MNDSTQLHNIFFLSTSAWSLNNKPSESGWPDSTTGVEVNTPPSVVDKGSLSTLESPWGTSQAGAGSYGLDIKPFEPGKQWMVCFFVFYFYYNLLTIFKHY